MSTKPDISVADQLATALRALSGAPPRAERSGSPDPFGVLAALERYDTAKAADASVPVLVPDDKDRGVLYKALHWYVDRLQKSLKAALKQGDGLTPGYAEVSAEAELADRLREGLMGGVYQHRVRAVGADRQPAFVVVQECGSSAERCIHASSTREDAEAFRAECAGDDYRTSDVIEVPAALAVHGEALHDVLEAVLIAELAFPEPEEVMKP